MFNHSTFQVDKKIKTVKKELIIRSNSDTVDFAMLNDGKLVELDKENMLIDRKIFQDHLFLVVFAINHKKIHTKN